MNCLEDDRLMDLVDLPDENEPHLRDCSDCQLRRAELAVAESMLRNLRDPQVPRARGGLYLAFAAAAAVFIGIAVYAFDSKPQNTSVPLVRQEDASGKFTLEAEDVEIETVIKEFRRQVPGVKFEFAADGLIPEFRIPKLSLCDLPWREAFTEFLSKAGAFVSEESPIRIRFWRPSRLTASWKDADIKTVLNLIAAGSKANLILAAEIKGTVTTSIDNVPWNAALSTIAKTIGGTTVLEAPGIVRILYVKDWQAALEIKEFPLKDITVKGGAPTVKAWLRSVATRDVMGEYLGYVEIDPAGKVIRVKEDPRVVKKMTKLLEGGLPPPAEQSK